jgi:hypothetical protein
MLPFVSLLLIRRAFVGSFADLLAVDKNKVDIKAEAS